MKNLLTNHFGICSLVLGFIFYLIASFFNRHRLFRQLIASLMLAFVVVVGLNHFLYNQLLFTSAVTGFGQSKNLLVQILFYLISIPVTLLLFFLFSKPSQALESDMAEDAFYKIIDSIDELLTSLDVTEEETDKVDEEIFKWTGLQIETLLHGPLHDIENTNNGRIYIKKLTENYCAKLHVVKTNAQVEGGTERWLFEKIELVNKDSAGIESLVVYYDITEI